MDHSKYKTYDNSGADYWKGNTMTSINIYLNDMNRSGNTNKNESWSCTSSKIGINVCK